MSRPDPKRASFAEMAVALFEAAQYQAEMLELGESLIASLPENTEVERVYCSLRWRAEMIGQAHELFKAMCEHEDEIRKIIAPRLRSQQMRLVVGR